MRKDENGNPCPSTLGEYYDMCYSIAPKSKAIVFLSEMINEPGVTRDSPVIAKDSQMRALLMPLLTQTDPRAIEVYDVPSEKDYRDRAKIARIVQQICLALICYTDLSVSTSTKMSTAWKYILHVEAEEDTECLFAFHEDGKVECVKDQKITEAKIDHVYENLIALIPDEVLTDDLQKIIFETLLQFRA